MDRAQILEDLKLWLEEWDELNDADPTPREVLYKVYELEEEYE